MRVLLVFIILAVCGVGPAFGHEVRPGYLEIKELETDTVQVRFKQPIKILSADRIGGLGLNVHLTEPCELDRPSQRNVQNGYLVERATYSCPGGLLGRDLKIDGLEQSLTDVYLDLQYADGRNVTALLNAHRPRIMLNKPASLVLPIYFVQGIKHLLAGTDHVLFVLGLVLLVRRTSTLFLVVTSFTIAHSITLAITVFHIVSVPSGAIEACIALSIVFLAFELTRSERDSISLVRRFPAAISFVFGLLHGFGFAGALAELGLPSGQMIAALALFNIGLEIGQLLVVGAALVISAGMWALSNKRSDRFQRLASSALCIGAGYFMTSTLASL